MEANKGKWEAKKNYFVVEILEAFPKGHGKAFKIDGTIYNYIHTVHPYS